MDTHPTLHVLQERACGALALLTGIRTFHCTYTLAHARSNTFNAAGNEQRAEAARKGGVHSVLSAMRAHAMYANVQKYGCDVLVNLALNSNHTTPRVRNDVREMADHVRT